ncbi:hypothetical protein HK097_003831, partial [Rhizophlyctis rosea]
MHKQQQQQQQQQQQFGSPSAGRRPAPNLLLLIDIAAPSNPSAQTPIPSPQPTSPVATSFQESIQIAVLRTLLFFHLHVDSRFCWSYQIFDSSTPSSAISRTGASGRSQVFSLTSLAAFSSTLEKELSRSAPASKSPVTPIKSISIALRKALTDFSWTSTASFLSSNLPSPAKPLRLRSNSSKAPLKITNYLFLFSRTPRSALELARFVGSNARSLSSLGGSSKPNEWRRGERILGMAEMAELDRHLDVVQQELVGGLWESFMEKRISVSWVDVTAYDVGVGSSVGNARGMDVNASQ